jgi:hypothetical protein
LHQRRGDEFQAGLRPSLVQANNGARVAFRRGRGSGARGCCHAIATSCGKSRCIAAQSINWPALLNLLDTCPIIAEQSPDS